MSVEYGNSNIAGRLHSILRKYYLYKVDIPYLTFLPYYYIIDNNRHRQDLWKVTHPIGSYHLVTISLIINLFVTTQIKEMDLVTIVRIRTTLKHGNGPPLALPPASPSSPA